MSTLTDNVGGFPAGVSKSKDYAGASVIFFLAGCFRFWANFP
tara:strand:- start:76 stop:201 length:126 start_codon:yes stop_codon:yes gene_type:complete